MKLTIKEIEEKCEKDDKITFRGIVKKVFDFNDKKTKFSIGYQNIMVKDDTGEIKVIYYVKDKKELYDSSIEGKKTEVSGKVSIYKGKPNIFGRLTFEEAVKPVTAKTASAPVTAVLSETSGITIEEIRIKCLELTSLLYKSEKDATTKEWVAAARIFEAYVNEDSTQATIKDKPKQSIKQTKKDESKPSTEHIKGINTLMAIVESRGEEGNEIINNMIEENNYNSVKDFTEEDMEEATGKLENLGTEEIPF